MLNPLINSGFLYRNPELIRILFIFIKVTAQPIPLYLIKKPSLLKPFHLLSNIINILTKFSL